MQKQADLVMTRIELLSDRAGPVARLLLRPVMSSKARTRSLKTPMMDDHVLDFTVGEITILPPKHDEHIYQGSPNLSICSTFLSWNNIYHTSRDHHTLNTSKLSPYTIHAYSISRIFFQTIQIAMEGVA